MLYLEGVFEGSGPLRFSVSRRLKVVYVNRNGSGGIFRAGRSSVKLDGQCRRDRRPMGRRGQGQGRGLAVASRADVVVRFQGGHNAGHTLVVGNETYKLARCCRRGWCAANFASSATASWSIPRRCWPRSRAFRRRGFQSRRKIFGLPENATLILPFHRRLTKCARKAAKREDRHNGTRHWPRL